MFGQINGKPLAEATFEELMQFFTERVFFSFMDSGRAGIRFASQEYIGTMIRWGQERTDIKVKNVVRVTKALSDDDYKYLLQSTEAALVNAFITEGTKGIPAALVSSHIHLHNLFSKN